MSEPTASTPASAAGLEREAERLATEFEALRKLQSSTRTVLLSVMILIVAMFLVFMWATWNSIQQNFSQQNVQNAVVVHAEEILPRATEALGEAVYEAWPTYQALAVKRWEADAPVLAANAQDRFEQVPAEVARELPPKLQAVYDRVVDRLEPELQKAYPNLPASRRAEMVKAFQEDLAKQIEARAMQHATNQLVRYDAVLQKFNVPENPAAVDLDAAAREFLYELTLLVGYEIKAHESPEDLPTRLESTAAPLKPAAAQ